MEQIWIVAATTNDARRVYLTDYAGQFKHDVVRKVMDGARHDGYGASLAERLAELRWEIVCLNVEEAVPNETAYPFEWLNDPKGSRFAMPGHAGFVEWLRRVRRK